MSLSPRSDLLAFVPDEPSWVEARGLLLARDSMVWADERRESFVVAEKSGRIAAAVGAANASSILAAAAGLGPTGSLLAYPSNVASVRTVLPEWRCERAIIHEGGHAGEAALAGAESPRWLAQADVPLIEDAELREEIAETLREHPVAAGFEDAAPVSFCHASWTTENWWDVAIDTCARFRRRGHAVRVARGMMAWMGVRGRRPVWGALESNHASLRLAAKLGFVPAGEIFVLSPRPTV